LEQRKVRTDSSRLTLGIRFAWFLVAFLAALDRWNAIFDASSNLIAIYALDFLGPVLAFYCVYRKQRPKDDKGTQDYRGYWCAGWSFSRFERWFLLSPWAMLRSRCRGLSRGLCA
jgi:hypothetical protein